MDKIKLICFPYAGGTSLIYNNWKKEVDSNIEIYSPELKGRGIRYKEPSPENLITIIDDIYNNIKLFFKDSDYSLFGHSMGGLIVYELYKKIKKHNMPLPKAIFISGMYAPTINIKEYIHLYSDEKIIEKIKLLGGTPEIFLKNKEFMKLYIPKIRSDYKMLETYTYKNTHIKIHI